MDKALDLFPEIGELITAFQFIRVVENLPESFEEGFFSDSFDKMLYSYSLLPFRIVFELIDSDLISEPRDDVRSSFIDGFDRCFRASRDVFTV